MTFTLSPATEADIPGIIAVWNSAFWQEAVRMVFPDTSAGREWRAKSFERSMKTPSQHCTHTVIIEDAGDGAGNGKGEVVAFARYFRYDEGEYGMDWRSRWEPTLPADMKVEMVEDVFFEPMARQHRAIMGERAHYFLEVLATVTEYQKKGLGSRLLEEVCAKADKEGLELYLDAGKAAMPLYEKFGFVEQVEKQDPKASVPMLRGARKEGE